MGSKSAPKAPDYAGAAQATAQGNLEAARAAAAANRVNQYTPYGSLEYTKDPNAGPDDGWSATQTLSPVEQEKLEKTDALSLGLLGTAGKGLSYVDETLATGGALDEGKLAQPAIYGQSVQDAVMSRLDPQIKADRNALATSLANKGVYEGSEAWKNAFQTQDFKENDLRTNAALQGINTALAARQQGIQEQYSTQDRPLNIINALRTGNQVNLPNFVNVPQQQTTQGADMLGAAQLQGQAANDQYSAQQASQSSNIGAAATVAAAYFL